MSPEILKHGKYAEGTPYTIYSDMYAYGIVLFELFAGEIPYNSQPFLQPGILLPKVGHFLEKKSKKVPYHNQYYCGHVV